MRRNMTKDQLVEFKPRHPQVVYGVRNGSYRAYVWDLGHTPEAWEGKRFKISLQQKGEVLGYHTEADTLEEAKEKAKEAVRGKALRHLLRRMGGEQ